METTGIKKVLILGAGTMGQQIGFVCAMHGYRVMLYDVSPEALEDALRRIRDLGAWFAAAKKIRNADLDGIMGRIEAGTDAARAAQGADLINESLPENPELKATVFAQFNGLCGEKTIFTTNTSMLVPSQIAGKTGRPDRFLALHFHDVKITRVVDIMPHPDTDPGVVRLVQDFVKSIGQLGILVKKENHGYVFNTMVSNLFMSALTMASRDIASIEDIDRSFMGVLHTSLGPFGMMDQVGLSTVWMITEYWANKKGGTQARMNADFLKKYVDRGMIGLKAKKGFYTYPDPAFSRSGFLEGNE